MQEIEILSWLTLDAIKNAAKVAEIAGNLQTGPCKSIFCKIEDDYLELYYSDTGSNLLRRYENKDEYDDALEKRKKEEGEAPFVEDQGYEDAFEDEVKEEIHELEDDSEKY
ncbi:MAG: hypothetical protein E3I52_03840 [Candidatus Aminicenantes bacterium]|nr:MAG: hypothetical protein E3I52_03840 [Candidatus Aminicenantes bacterium]